MDVEVGLGQELAILLGPDLCLRVVGGLPDPVVRVLLVVDLVGPDRGTVVLRDPGARIGEVQDVLVEVVRGLERRVHVGDVVGDRRVVEEGQHVEMVGGRTREEPIVVRRELDRAVLLDHLRPDPVDSGLLHLGRLGIDDRMGRSGRGLDVVHAGQRGGQIPRRPGRDHVANHRGGGIDGGGGDLLESPRGTGHQDEEGERDRQKDRNDDAYGSRSSAVHPSRTCQVLDKPFEVRPRYIRRPFAP